MQKKLLVSVGIVLTAIGLVLVLHQTPARPASAPVSSVRTTTNTPSALPRQVMIMQSSAFQNGSAIPRQYTCDGANTPPPLNVTGIPMHTVSLALVMEDPDAPNGTWVHWLLWDLPPDTVSIAYPLPAAGVEGVTSSGKPGYGGPCPPSGTHRYYFRLYALDIMPDLSPSSRRAALDAAIRDHIIDRAELMGTYTRQH